MTTNAELIAEARAIADDWRANFKPASLLTRLADALEACEARVARLLALVYLPNDQESTATRPPADLLEAIETWDNLLYMEYSDFLPEDGKKARATLVRYGLLEEPLRPGEEQA